MDLSDGQVGLIAAGVALLGVLLTAIQAVGVRQQALREAELLQKLHAMDMKEEERIVRRILRTRLYRWVSRRSLLLSYVSNFFVLSGVACTVYVYLGIARAGDLTKPMPLAEAWHATWPAIGGMVGSYVLAWIASKWARHSLIRTAQSLH